MIWKVDLDASTRNTIHVGHKVRLGQRAGKFHSFQQAPEDISKGNGAVASTGGFKKQIGKQNQENVVSQEPRKCFPGRI